MNERDMSSLRYRTGQDAGDKFLRNEDAAVRIGGGSYAIDLNEGESLLSPRLIVVLIREKSQSNASTVRHNAEEKKKRSNQRARLAPE